jgi:hypothetical protein
MYTGQESWFSKRDLFRKTQIKNSVLIKIPLVRTCWRVSELSFEYANVSSGLQQKCMVKSLASKPTLP